MKIELIKSQNIALTKLEINKGQIEGLPKNPRLIKDSKFEKLKKSIEDNPEMLGMREVLVYPHGSKFVIIGGNMRFQACKDLGFTEVPCKVLDKDTTAEQLRAITIKDNVGFGEHDWELLANEWEAEELDEWGVELPVQYNSDIDYFDVDDKIDNTNSNSPKASDDDYSTFELVMLHENKLTLLDTLNKIKNNFLFEKQEEALMELIRIYNKNN